MLAPVPLGQYRAQVGGRRRARRWRRPDLGPDRRGDPLTELGAGAGGELGQAAEILAGHGRCLVAEPGQLQAGGPGRELRRRHRRPGGRPLGGQPVLDDEGAREEIAEAFPLVRQQGGDEGRDAEQQPEVNDRGEPPDQGLPEALGAAVVADHPQAKRELPRRSAPGRGLPDDRVADHGQDDDREHDGLERCLVHDLVRRAQPGDDQQDHDHRQLDRQVDAEGEQAAGEPGARHLEDDGLPGDDSGHDRSQSHPACGQG